MNGHLNDCLICDGKLEYLDAAEEMECVICHKKHLNNVRCINRHYICDECHSKSGARLSWSYAARPILKIPSKSCKS